MYSANLENELIVVDIISTLADWASIQLDIDETKVKSAAIVAQRVDLKRILKDDLARCKDPQTEADEELRELVVPALCYYTYARCLSMNRGVLTDGGYAIEEGSADREDVKATVNEIRSIGAVFLNSAVEFLQEEDPETEVSDEGIVTGVRVFGGEENRASN